MKWNQKWKIPHTVLERQTLCSSSYKNCKLKVKLWWVGANERKKMTLFVLFILSERNFFNICVLFQCLLYWIHFRIYTLLCIKRHYFVHFLLVFKIVESLQCILNVCIGIMHISFPVDNVILQIGKVYSSKAIIKIFTSSGPKREPVDTTSHWI